jgi:hypothetical protein
MTDRIMIDGVNWRAVIAAVEGRRVFLGIPATMGAGYQDGPLSAWPAAAWPELTRVDPDPVTISVFGLPRARLYDVEHGDLTPITGAAVALTEHLARRFPVLYVNRDNKAELIGCCQARGLAPGTDYGLDVATLDGSFKDLDGTDLRSQSGVGAIQFLGATDADPFDITLITNPGWWLPPPPPTAPSWQADGLQLAGELAALLKAHQ